MRKKLRYRYYCDHCKKSGGSAYHIRHHEERCTANHDRTCGMCIFCLGEYNRENFEMCKGILYPYRCFDYEVDDYGDHWSINFLPKDVVDDALESVDGCPVCFFAAMNQLDIPIFCADGFDFDARCKEWLATRNEELAGDM